jgi:hypothetical protein
MLIEYIITVTFFILFQRSVLRRMQFREFRILRCFYSDLTNKKMTKKQKTIIKPVTLSGKGLHTGLQVDLTFRPAAENHGYVFKRMDLENQPLVHAQAECY